MRADSVTLQHCQLVLWGQSPALLSELELRAVPLGPGPFPRLSEPLAPPRPGLLRAGWLQSPGSQAPPRSSLKQLPPAGINRLLCERGSGVPYGFDGGAWFQSIGVIPPK